MLDGEIPEALKAKLTPHLEGCSACQGELESLKTFHAILRSHPSTIEPSKDFEARFWNKVSSFPPEADQPLAGGEQKEPWFIGLLKELDSLIPHPSTPQLAMVVLMAFLVGSTGGAVSAMNSMGSLEVERNSVKYLSGFHEFKGVPSSSVAASYLKVIDQ